MWSAESEQISLIELTQLYKRTIFMNEINNLAFLIQDGDYALTMENTSLSNLVVQFAFGNYLHFETNFLLPLKWQNFW